jgi:hypothetical protein
MSFYATVEGNLSYEKREDFNRAIEALGGWINSSDIFIGEADEQVTSNSTIDKKHLTIYIPYFHYRNITRVFDQVIPGSKGWIVWTSTDGCFEAGVIRDSVETTYNLEDWAKDNIEESKPNQDDEWENWTEWANEVEMAFNEEFGGEV